jgi:hypothetical protein
MAVSVWVNSQSRPAAFCPNNHSTERAVCLGIPGKVVEIYREHDILMRKVDFGGIAKRDWLTGIRQVRTNSELGMILTPLFLFPGC